MIETNVQGGEISLMEKGRHFLQNGNIASALEWYAKVSDPESLDEAEAREMLIEARSHLSHKFLVDAVESFEEALLMGTDVQRRQALDGISKVGEIRLELKSLVPELKAGLRDLFGDADAAGVGFGLINDEENIVLISQEALESLPGHLAKSSKIDKLPPHLRDQPLPFPAQRCIPFVSRAEVRFILDVAAALAGGKESPAES